MLKEQGGIDPITKLQITDPVLDHDHGSGDVRAVLQRWNNGVLGKIENWASRAGAGLDPIVYLKSVVAYLEFHQAYPSGLKYPTFKTEDEKRLARNKAARVRRKTKKESA